MLKVLNEDSYSWLLSIRNLKSDYVKKYIENYIENLFNIQIDITEDDIEFDLDSATLFGSIQDTLESGNYYKLSKDYSTGETYYNKKYNSVECEYNHQVALIGDFENYQYALAVTINDSAVNLPTDQDIINLYNSNDKLLMSLISDKRS